MTLRLVDSAWSTELTQALRADTSELRIVCPYIKTGALDRLLALKPKVIQVITRFNLADFAEGVSDIAALLKVLVAGGQVRGIKNLHAKLYLFGGSRAIVTSANLTAAALDRNEEFGAVLDDASSVTACAIYFERLWSHAGADVSADTLEQWDATVTQQLALGARPAALLGLPDFGVVMPGAAGGEPAPVAPVSTVASLGLTQAVSEGGQVFVKFLGTAKDRELLSFDTLAEVKRAGCHWALAYPASQRPRIVRDGDLMFIARMTREPNDMRIFGWAVGMQHQPGRDDATADDVALRRYKAQWSRYVRVHHASFVAGALVHGVSLNDLIDDLGPQAFATTQENAADDDGGGNTDPRAALRRKAAVRLSRVGAAWVAERLGSAFAVHGAIPQTDLDALDWPTIP